MQRKITKQSMAASTNCKRFFKWIKERGICAACGRDCGFGNVICHHVVGSSKKVYVGVERVHIGNEFVIGLCQSCDDLVTHGTRKALTDLHGQQADMWAKQYRESPVKFSEKIVTGILNSGY